MEFIASELEKSVKAQLMADVPLGAFLSGGIDSPLICRYAQKNINDKLKTFTIGSHSRVHDESDMALQYASLLNADSELEIMSSNSAASIMDEVMKTVAEPFADTSIIPTFLVSKLAVQKVKVALSGDGGDELFYGYERFWSVAKNRHWHSFPYPLRALVYGADKKLSRSRNINSVVLAKSQGAGHQKLLSGTVYNGFMAVAPDLDYQAHYVAPEYRYHHMSKTSDLVQQMRYSEFYDMMQKTLRKVDLASMGNSLEVRVPFLHKSFIEASLKVDFSLSYGKNKKKELLKHLIRREYPGVAIDNTKKGFSVPFTRWLRDDLRQEFQQVLLEKSTADYFGFSLQGTEQILNGHLNGSVDNKWLLFSLYSLFKWYNNTKNR
jgi:asparagine synthase (glutamine-hydrolysing)